MSSKMKILVDKMPYLDSDCFFYDGYNCKITGYHCAYFDAPCRNRNPNDCECLTTLKTKINDAYNDRKD